jgi:energy-coupling factor transport system permease protein
VAHLVSFHYGHGTSFLHRLDERLKIFLVLAFGSAPAFVEPSGLAVLAVALAAAIIASKIRIARLLYELKGFYVFLAFLFALSAYSGEGRPVIDFIIPLPSEAGILAALLLIGRLLLLILSGAVFLATTIQTRLTAACRSILDKVPFVPAAFISTMMGLAVAFVPVLLDLWGEVSDAVRSRGSGRIRNPVTKIVLHARPLLVQILTRTEEIAEAMEARCYDGDYTKPGFRISIGDALVFSGGLAICAFALCAGFFF